MVSEVSRGRFDFYDFDKPENTTNLYWQSNWPKLKKKKSVIRSYRKPLEPGFLPSIVHPACDIKFAGTCERLESLYFKPATRRNLKHEEPSVRALPQFRVESISDCKQYVQKGIG